MNLYDNHISNAGATSIAKAIRVNKTLTNLSLSHNRISDAGAASIAKTIKVNKTLTNLNLDFRYMKIHIFAVRWRDEIKRSSQLRTLLKRVVVNRT